MGKKLLKGIKNNSNAIKRLEEQMNKLQHSFENCSEILTVNDLIQLTGFSKSYLYKLTSLGEIPHYKPKGKLLFFKRSEVEEWLLQNRIKSNSELESEAATFLTCNMKGGRK